MVRIKRSSAAIMLSKGLYFTKSLLSNTQHVSGYASVFDIVDSHGDIVQKDAFAKVIKDFNDGRNIPLLWQLDSSQPVGVIESLIEDEYGLYIHAKILTSTFRGLESYNLIKADVICNFSIGYKPIRYYTDYERNARILEEIDLWEVSLVTFPANAQSCITACA